MTVTVTMIDNPIHLTVELEANLYSQSGEDGVIARVLNLQGVNDVGVCIDIGAGDGKFLSNTAALRDRGWRSLLVDKDPGWNETLKKIPRAVVMIAEIRPSNVVHMMEGCGGVDVMSIDIDGDDLNVFSALVRGGGVRPRIVCMEYNPTYPPFLDRVNPIGTSKGSSLAAIARVCGEIEYDLVYATISNAILVDRRRNENILARSAFETFRWDQVRYVVSDFDGQNHLANMTEIVNVVRNPWDSLNAAVAIQYPEHLLGFNRNRAGRVGYTSWLDGLKSDRKTLVD